MKYRIKIIFLFAFILVSVMANAQSSEIIKLDEENAYIYQSYYKNGSIKSIVGFYTRKPYSSVEEFEGELKKYKIKYHGERKDYYESGKLQELVVYKKGKVMEFAKN